MASDSGPLTWPADWLDPGAFARQWALIRPDFVAALQSHRIPAASAEELARVYLPLAAWVMAQKQDGPLIIGVNGAQGSGKSTLCDFLRLILEQCHGQQVSVLSIDDLYLTRAERQALARAVHPLLITRGVPGTHDVELGLATLQRLRSATGTDLTPLPAFDKAADDRRPQIEWPMFRGRPDIILFEGWCVGSTPQPDADLIEPVNALERDEDADGRWRHFVNHQLATDYRRLFAELDRLIFLRVPDMERVLEWRTLQEQKLAATATAGRHVMDAAALRRFVMHYERLTRHNLAELPAQADVTLSLNERHGFDGLVILAAPQSGTVRYGGVVGNDSENSAHAATSDQQARHEAGDLMKIPSCFTEIDRLKARLDSLRPLPEHTVRTLHEQHVLEWTYHSNAIEGNMLTLKETKVVLEGITIGGKLLREHLEVINHKEAIDFVEELVSWKRELSEWQVKSLHQLILKNIDARNAGRYRQENVAIAGAEHVPPDFLKVPAAMEGLLRWYHAAGDEHPARRAARLHVDFVGIHPFVDGNGRISRLLMNFELMRSGFLPVIIPVEQRLSYYEALDRAHSRSEYGLFIELVAGLERQTLERYLRFMSSSK